MWKFSCFYGLSLCITDDYRSSNQNTDWRKFGGRLDFLIFAQNGVCMDQSLHQGVTEGGT